MEVRKKIAVQEWVKPISPSQHSRPVVTGAWKSPALLGIFGTLLFHVLLVASLGVSFGGRSIGPTKPEQSRVDRVGPSDSLVLLSLSAIPRSRELNIDLRPPSKVLDNAPVLLKPRPSVNTERLALLDESATAGNAELAQAAEIYDRQIRARIERIWEQPQTFDLSSKKAAASDGDGVFRCQAQLEQDERGNVIEVLLPICNGSAEWRDSLLSAIRQASPLPAPPDPRVFSSSLVLHFVISTRSIRRRTDDYQ